MKTAIILLLYLSLVTSVASAKTLVAKIIPELPEKTGSVVFQIKPPANLNCMNGQVATLTVGLWCRSTVSRTSKDRNSRAIGQDACMAIWDCEDPVVPLK